MERAGIENILDTGGRNLNAADRQFVSTLFSELEQFQYQAPKDRALMFHPLGGYQRYLIHKVTEIFPKLTSFSIGDDQNRRTVVCFKSKRKEQQMRQMAPASPAKQHLPARPNDYGPTNTRSRESSRARNKPHDTVPSRPLSRHGKNPNQTNYLPKPLRAKKRNSKVANSLPRSRSLHASPARRQDHDPYYSNDDSHMRPGRGDGPDLRKDMQRSSSARDKAKARSRPTTPDSLRPKSATMTRSPTENSLKRRGQGLRMEGMVVNGDVEDPENRDSDLELARSDAEAIKREKSRKAKDKRHKSRRAKSEPEFSDKESSRSRRRRKQVSSPHVGHHSDSDGVEHFKPSGQPYNVNGHRKPDKQTPRGREPVSRRKSETSIKNGRDHSSENSEGETDERNHRLRNRGRETARLDNRGLDVSSDDSDHLISRRPKSIDANDDEIPPSYDKSSNMEPSASKAKRNLNRIRRSDSLKSQSTSNRSPSNSSIRSDTMPRQPKESASKHKTTATFPRHQSKPRSGSEDEVDGNPAEKRRQRSTSVDNPPKYNNIEGQKSRKKSVEKGKPKSKSKTTNVSVEPLKSSPRHKERDVLRHPSDDNIAVSVDTLYTPLPDKLVTAYVEPTPEHEYINKPENMATLQQPPSSHSTLSSPITDGSQGFNTTTDLTDRCDGEAQTELTGTLTRKAAAAAKRTGASPRASRESLGPKSAVPETTPPQVQETGAPSKAAAPSGAGNEKLMEEFCKVMLNFQKMFIVSQTSATPSATEPSFPGPMPGPGSEPFHPFRSYYVGSSPDSQASASPVPPAALYNQFPPQVAHQLYLSWMAAYYAGATGSWPPPPPPFQPRMTPSHSHGSQYETVPMPTPEMQRVPYDHVEGDRADSAGQAWDAWYPKHHDQELQSDYYPLFNGPSSLKGQKGHVDSEPTRPDSKGYPSENDRFGSISESGVHPNWERGERPQDYNSPRLSHSSSRASKPSDASRRRSNSAAVTDGADTDVSSATSSSTHPEIAMKESKTGVVVYVRSSSQSNSQANSTVSGGEDGISLHSSSSHGLTIPVKVASVAGRVNNHSRDGDDEETPDPDSKPPAKMTDPSPAESRKSVPSARKNHKKGPSEGHGSATEDKFEGNRSAKNSEEVPVAREMPDGDQDSESEDDAHREDEPSEKLVEPVNKPDVGSKYYNWTPNEELYSAPPYDSIVEIHDFPPEFKDKDILKHFKKIKGFKLVWVDDTHALGMLPSAEDTKAALGLNVPMMRLRPLVHASSQSRKKAKVRVEEFGDYRTPEPAPERSNVVAKKMVLGALGLKESRKDKEKRAELEARRQSKKKKT